jgi:hypothetical protein
VTTDMSIYREEIFGPVLVVARAADYEEALRMASEHEFGNGVGIFTRDGDAARDFVARVNVGMVGVNVPIPVPIAYFTFGVEAQRLRRPEPARRRRLPLLHEDQDRPRDGLRGRPRRRQLHPSCTDPAAPAGTPEGHDMTTVATPITMTSEERAAILGAVREFAETELAPFAAERDEKHLFPRDTLVRAGELGLGGIYARGVRRHRARARRHRRDLRGAREGRPDHRRLHLHPQHGRLDDRHLRHGRAARALDARAHHHGGAQLLPHRAGAGSDAAALATSATRDGDEYVLTGVKQFISGAGEAAVYIVMARTAPPARAASPPSSCRGRRGLSFGAPEKKMGWHAQPTRQVILTACGCRRRACSDPRGRASRSR